MSPARHRPPAVRFEPEAAAVIEPGQQVALGQFDHPGLRRMAFGHVIKRPQADPIGAPPTPATAWLVSLSRAAVRADLERIAAPWVAIARRQMVAEAEVVLRATTRYAPAPASGSPASASVSGRPHRRR